MIKIALAGNPNSGKTSLFNVLTGSNQFVGNWPGVTVEKKEGKLKKHDNVTVVDLPGIYSLSPYTEEEVVARNFIVNEHPDVILNIVDGTNLERNLYLTTQLVELGVPVVVAINLMDVIKKNGDHLNTAELSRRFGCPVVEISALKGTGCLEASEVCIKHAQSKKIQPCVTFAQNVEQAIAKVEGIVHGKVDRLQQRWFAIKLLERDSRAQKFLKLDEQTLQQIEQVVVELETALDDDSESIITNERYVAIESLIKGCYHKQNQGKLTVSDKIDKVVTNRFLALPIFALVMFLVYFISVSTVGTWATDWANDGLFGDGFHLFGIGQGQYEQAVNDHATEHLFTQDYVEILQNAVANNVVGAQEMLDAVTEGDFFAFNEAYGVYADVLVENGHDVVQNYEIAFGENSNAPSPEQYGVWVPSIPVLVGKGLEAINCAPWLQSLVIDGIIGGVGAVLGFVPQMLVLFLLLAFLEACGYMARVAFVMDKLFRKFGLSGKSFIPMLIGTGCSVPGIMAGRTIENASDRRMTIITTSFIPCGAKLPIIALIASALFGGAWWVAPVAYFIGVVAVILSGIMLKKSKLFAGDVAPFVMELPQYRMPTFVNLMRSTWERGWSFIKKAGTIILLASVVIWVGSTLGVVDGKWVFDTEMALENSLLGYVGNALSWLFAPLGFGNIKATVATIMGLVAKEEVVGVFGVLDFGGMTQLQSFSFLIFNLLCAPCFAAMGAIKREMNSAKWTLFALGYQTALAYSVCLVVYQFGLLFSGTPNVVGLIFAIAVLGGFGFFLFRPAYKVQKQK